MPDEKQRVIELIKQACQSGARQSLACDIIGITVKTFQRWVARESLTDGRSIAKRRPTNKLSEFERRQIIAIANEDQYASLSPSKIVPLLADEGRYIASESSFYRILKAEGQLTHRQASKPKTVTKPKALIATAPNQIYSWDITYLPTQVRGTFLYLYLMMDIYSRKIVGWQVHECECSQHAANLLIDVCRTEQISHSQVTLHSDNGSPMKGATMLATLQQLGVIPSFSRPSVSNDNAYSESLFKTLKYRPDYPQNKFASLDVARHWVSDFVNWYNYEHQHSAIKFVTPVQRHEGNDTLILQKRHEVYQQAYAENPSRWSKNTRNWEAVKEVSLNPNKATGKQQKGNQRAA